MMEFILKLALVSGLAGYFNYLVNVKQISVFIAPSVMITAICAAMYLCGLVNIMPIGVYVIIGIGIILGLYYRKNFSFAAIRENKLAIALCLLLLVYLIYYTYSGVYMDGDTMTHWGVIVRSVFRDDRLPNFSNIEIGYQSYPPATACWIYFLLKIFGYGEGKALFAQGLWMLACAISCFEFNKTKNKWGDILIASCILFNLRWMDSLLVDIILALSVTAAAVGIYEFRYDPQKQFMMLLPFMIVIPAIKNSGILFIFFLVICILLTCECSQKTKWKWAGCSISLAGASLFLWEAHIKMVYSNANTSRHSMSLDYMKSVFLSKSVGEIRQIFLNFIKTWFSFNGSYEWQVILAFAGIVLLAFIIHGKSRKLIKGPLLMGAFYLTYKICLLGMYVINMPGKDAVNIGGYRRYQHTFTILIIFFALWYYFIFIQERPFKGKYLKFMTPLITIGVFAVVGSNVTTYARPDYEGGGIHRKLVSMVNQKTEDIHCGDKVLIYDDYEASVLFVRFTFENKECGTIYDIEAAREVLTENKNQYDYFVIFTRDDQIAELLRAFGYAEDVECIRLNR